jgi:hypothetical protein
MNKEPDGDFNSIFYFIDIDRLDLIQLLKPEVIKNQKGKNGNTPLLYALENNKFEVAAWLLTKRFFNSLFETNDYGQNFLSVCYLKDFEGRSHGAFSEHYLPTVLSERQMKFFKEHLSPVIRHTIESIKFDSFEKNINFIEECNKIFREFFPLYDCLKFKITACQRFANYFKAREYCCDILKLEEMTNFFERRKILQLLKNDKEDIKQIVETFVKYFDNPNLLKRRRSSRLSEFFKEETELKEAEKKEERDPKRARKDDSPKPPRKDEPAKPKQ